MSKHTDIKLFEDRKVRSVWDQEMERWYISIVDVVSVLTDSIDPNAYWRKLKQRLKEEGNETVTNYHGLKMPAPDGKMRLTDVADTELILSMLAEASTTDISAATQPKNFEESKKVARQGGNVAKVARKELEAKTGKKVVTALNAKSALSLNAEDKGKTEKRKIRTNAPK